MKDLPLDAGIGPVATDGLRAQTYEVSAAYGEARGPHEVVFLSWTKLGL